MADVLSGVTTCLDPDTVRSILDGITLGAVQWVEMHDPTMVEGDHNLEQEVCVAPGCILVQMHETDWTEAQRGGSSAEGSFRLVGSPKKDTFRGACLQ